MQKAVQKLIKKAQNIEPKSEALLNALSALIAIGESATHSNTEYKALDYVIKQIKSGNSDEDGAGEPETGTGDADGAGDAENGTGEAEAGTNGAGADGEAGYDSDAGSDSDETDDDANASDAGAGANVSEDEDEKPKRKINHDNTRMIGSRYYNKKDGYKKGFATANECSMHFNGYRD